MKKEIEKLEFDIQKEGLIMVQNEEEVEKISKGIGKVENTLVIKYFFLMTYSSRKQTKIQTI